VIIISNYFIINYQIKKLQILIDMAELKDTPEEAMLRENLDTKIISF
jgi:hypothetical protein